MKYGQKNRPLHLKKWKEKIFLIIYNKIDEMNYILYETEYITITHIIKSII